MFHTMATQAIKTTWKANEQKTNLAEHVSPYSISYHTRHNAQAMTSGTRLVVLGQIMQQTPQHHQPDLSLPPI